MLHARSVLALSICVFVFAGCAALAPQTSGVPEASVEHLEYYAGEVKGYGNTYPGARILLLLPVDGHWHPSFTKPEGVPLESAEIGVVSDSTGTVVQEIYTPPIQPLVQKALVQSGKEAGMISRTSSETLEEALHDLKQDYVLVSKITRCWVAKRQGLADSFLTQRREIWETRADFGLEVEIYKPPFHAPFWRGSKAVTYYDPPVAQGIQLEDSVAIFDHPGEVLSVAMTRTVAGIFASEELRNLVAEDYRRKTLFSSRLPGMASPH